tara:strand:+ start:471 stop:1094 length:624 start_codon:yes stop_codon:yes gene_type:complete
MAIPTSPTSAQLAAVNEILMSVGQTPVTQLEATNPDVALAFETLTSVSREVQAEGWTFNRENHLSSFVPDSTTNKIQIPDNVIQIDLSDNHDNRSKDAVRRDGYLYDRENHTFEWNSTPEVDVVYLYDWGDLPKPIQDYIVSRAAAIFSSRVVGDPTQYQLLAQREAYNRAQALEYECNQGDYTYFGHPDGGNFYNSYEPYTALYRY